MITLGAFRPDPYSKQCSPRLPAQPLLASGRCRHLRCFSTGGVTVGQVICGFNYLFIFPPSYVALWGSNARHRPAGESVSWCLETSLFLKTPFPGWISVPTSFDSLFIFYIFSYLILKTMGCLSGYLMSSASIQKLFCGIYSAFKCSLDEFVGKKLVSQSYSSAILRLLPIGKILSKTKFWAFFFFLTFKTFSCEVVCHQFIKF